MSGYNGWSNHATWLVALHIDNDEGLQHEALSLARRETDSYELGEKLEAFVESVVYGDPDMGTAQMPNGLARDLISGYLADVDWSEIARHYIDDSEEVPS